MFTHPGLKEVEKVYPQLIICSYWWAGELIEVFLSGGRDYSSPIIKIINYIYFRSFIGEKPIEFLEGETLVTANPLCWNLPAEGYRAQA